MTRIDEALSVVLVAFHSDAVLSDCLAHLAEHLPAAEVIVVDNGSTLRREDLSEGLNVHLLTGHGNVGFGGGVNRGVTAAARPFVLVLNPDAVTVSVNHDSLASDLALAPLGILAASEVEHGSITPLLAPVRSWPVTLAKGVFRWFLAPRGLPRIPAMPARVVRLSGAAFFVARKEFLALGGFDERLFLYHEDDEISHRYADAGKPIRATQAFVVNHAQGTSSTSNSARVLAWQLLGFVQLVYQQHGRRAAFRAARATIWSLRAVQAAARGAARIPPLTARATTKGRYAGDVLEQLHAEASSPPTPQAFANVRELFRAPPS